MTAVNLFGSIEVTVIHLILFFASFFCNEFFQTVWTLEFNRVHLTVIMMHFRGQLENNLERNLDPTNVSVERSFLDSFLW